MRHSRGIGVLAAAAMAVSSLLLTGCANSSDSTPVNTEGDSSNSFSSEDSNEGTASSLTDSDADIIFAQLMIPHHEQAVQMADMALKQSSAPDVLQLAQQIKDAQDPEIQQMRGWLGTWGAPERMDGMHGMDHGDMDMGGQSAGGMMSSEDMSALMNAQGSDFDQMWLEMMIEHHQGAIAMAESVKQKSQNSDVIALSNNIISAQQAEIATMQRLLVAG